MFYLEYIDVTKEKQKKNNDFEILERKFTELNIEKAVQKEELQKANSQKKESENLLFQEKAKVANLKKDLLKSKEELQSKTVQLEKYKLSMTEYFVNYIFYI